MLRRFRFVGLFAVFCATLWLSETASARMATDAASRFERFAVQRGTREVSAVEVGRVVSGANRAVVIAVVLENPRYEPGRMRGLRIELVSETANEHVYVDAGELAFLKAELARMACGIMANPGSRASHHVLGIAACRPSQSLRPSFCPGYYTDPESAGLGVDTRSGQQFRFPGAHPETLVTAFGKALEAFGLPDSMAGGEDDPVAPAVLEQVVAAAVSRNPELAASPGIKTAGYRDRQRHDALTAIFLPHARNRELAQGMLVRCHAVEGVWTCERGAPRGYLALPGQERDAVVLGPMSRDGAIALIESVRDVMSHDPLIAAGAGWWVPYIRVPDEHGPHYVVVLRNAAGEDVALNFDATVAGDGQAFALASLEPVAGCR